MPPSAGSGWPVAKVGGALSRMSGRVYSIPPAAAPRAQCLCRRVPGTVPEMQLENDQVGARGGESLTLRP